MCWYPISLNSRRTKEGVYIPPSLVPCGRCLECLQARRAAWSFRLQQELLKAKSATFLTLTYADHQIPKNSKGLYTLSKKALQNYFKRVRKHNNGKLLYYAVGEYGEKNNRPHYHAITFNCDRNALRAGWVKENNPIGFVTTDDVNEATIHYVTGYVLKKYGDIDYKSGVCQNTYPEGIQRPFALMSKGLGISYVENAKEYHLQNATFNTNLAGKNGVLSRYLKLKIFIENEELRLKINEEEKQKIIDKLIEQSSKKRFTARRYMKELVKHSQKNKKL